MASAIITARRVAQGVSEQEALAKGMEAKAVEFRKGGSEVYKKA